MPVARETTPMRSAGTLSHIDMADGETPISAASAAARPRSCSRYSRSLLMPAVLSLAEFSVKLIFQWGFMGPSPATGDNGS